MSIRGMLTPSDLVAAIDDGAIDTVLVAFPDLQGRLVGKRFHAQFFIESGYDETHACNYLLADDIDMETVPGYGADVEKSREEGRKIMRELGVGQDTLGVVRHYGPWVKGWVIDRADEALAEPIRARGHSVAVTDTLMRTPDIAASLAQTTVDLLRTLA